MHSRDRCEPEAQQPTAAEDAPQYSPPRIDLRLLTIVVQPNPYSRRTPLAGSRKPSLRKRWSS